MVRIVGQQQELFIVSLLGLGFFPQRNKELLGKSSLNPGKPSLKSEKWILKWKYHLLNRPGVQHPGPYQITKLTKLQRCPGRPSRSFRCPPVGCRSPSSPASSASQWPAVQGLVQGSPADTLGYLGIPGSGENPLVGWWWWIIRSKSIQYYIICWGLSVLWQIWQSTIKLMNLHYKL